jgi:hypothetical protein
VAVPSPAGAGHVKDAARVSLREMIERKTLATTILIALALSGATHAQSAWATGVTLADLDGSVIETSVVYDRTGRLAR